MAKANELLRANTAAVLLLLAGFIILWIAALSPWNINRMGGDIEQQIERQLLEERSR